MRFLHTSDWHLGRCFHREGLAQAHAAFVDHLVDTVRSEKVDAVLVAGDVYDRALPGPDAVEMLDDTLNRLVGAGAQVVLSSGNHDSARRLGFGARLLTSAGVHVRSDVSAVADPVMIGDVAVYAVPYLDPAAASVTGPLEVDERSHTAVMTGAMTRIRADREQRGPASIVLAHCFATGGAASDSERDITVGGVANVPLSVFDGVPYVALGHLHGRQQLSETVRYSGSPVAMSFSEAAHSKGSHLVDIDPATGRTEVTDVAAPVIRRLAVLRGTLEELLSDRRHTDAEDAWVQVVLTDTIRPLGAMDRLRRRFPGVLSLQFDPQGTVTPIRTYAQRVAQRAPLDVCADFLTDVRSGAGPDAAELDLLGRGLEESRRARAARADEGVAGTTAAASA